MKLANKSHKIFEELPIGSALDLLRADLCIVKKVKCTKLNSKKTLVNRKLLTEKNNLTKRGKELVW